MVSKSALNGNIHTATYAMSENTTRDTTPEKPCDIRGHQCLTSCHQNIDVGPPGLVECNILYENIKSMEGSFTVEAGTSPSLPQDYDTQTDRRSGQVKLLR